MAHCKVALNVLIAKQFRVYNYILDEDKQKERHVVALYLLLELTRNNIAARAYNYIRDEDKQKGEKEADRKARSHSSIHRQN